MDSSALHTLMAPPELTGCRKILCVQPHPDDNEVGMGGIIASSAEKDCEIHYLTVTNGDLGAEDEQLSHEEIAKIRRVELEAAGRMLGATEFHQLQHGDGTLDHVPSLAEEIAEIIRSVQPEALFCPDPWLAYEAHHDHIVVGKATAQAFLLAGLARYPKGTSTKPGSRRPSGFISRQSRTRSLISPELSSRNLLQWPSTAASSVMNYWPYTGSTLQRKAGSWPEIKISKWGRVEGVVSAAHALLRGCETDLRSGGFSTVNVKRHQRNAGVFLHSGSGLSHAPSSPAKHLHMYYGFGYPMRQYIQYDKQQHERPE